LDGRVHWDAAQEWLAGTRVVRSVVDTVLRGRARRHLAHLEQLPAARAQERTLIDLVRRARLTRFGREHDFSRIRSVEDFRRLVPLRRPADLWQTYWQPAYPNLTGATWPGPVQALAVGEAAGGRKGEGSNGTGSPSPPPAFTPVSPQLLAAHRRGIWTGLALVLGARPRAELFRGRILFVGGAGPPAAPEVPLPTGSLDEIGLRDLSPLLRPYTLGPRRDAGSEQPEALARRSAGSPVTCLVGEAEALLWLLDDVRRFTGRGRLLDTWPRLAAVLYWSARPGKDRPRLAEAVGTAPGSVPVLLLETWSRPEGTLAVEDPRHGLPRLLPEHGAFFEFVPTAEAEKPEPARHGVEDVEPGVAYEVALTSPAGVWACRAGLTVRFERRDPPLLRAVEPAAPVSPPREEPAVPARADQPRVPYPVQPPHPRTGGTPAGLPGMPAHIPWSVRAGPG
jgi:hypothetical protein